MYQVGYWSKNQSIYFGNINKKIMCDELTIFSYNESVFDNILDVYLTLKILHPLITELHL